MKKLLMFVAFAAFCITADAQSAGMKSYADEHMSLEFPDVFVADDSSDEHAFSASSEEGIGDMSLLLEFNEKSADSMKDWAQSNIDFVEGDEENWKFDALVIKDKMATLRSVGDYEWDDAKVKVVRMYFLVNSNKLHFKGNMTYKLDDEAKMKPLFEKMLASLKAIKY